MKKIFLLILLSAAMLLPAAERLLLPEIIYAAPELETNIYFVNAFNTINPQNFSFVVKCGKGKLETKRWCWTPSKADAGKKFPLTLEVYNDKGLVESAAATVSVAPESQKKTVKFTQALFADSEVNCLYPDHILKVMHEKGFSGYTPVGSHSGRGGKPVPGGVAHDGYGGWTWNSFLHCWYYTAAEFKSIQNQAEEEQLKAIGIWDVPKGQEYRIRTPLMKMVNGKLVDNVQGWLDKVNGGKIPDIFIIQLGANDVWRFSEQELNAGLYTKILADMKELIGRIRKLSPTVPIGIATGMYGCSQDGYGANYGCRLNRYFFQRNLFAYNKMVIHFVNTQKDPHLALLPLHFCIDPENSYIQKLCPAHARTKRKVVRDANGMHPSIAGGMQIGDTICAWLMHVKAEMEKSGTDKK